ncbi:hypothetical protein [Streptomyces tendae]|uniref:hypothetical protein n=1 Tax=Streptomyces tendae TaxID=1932 RepID=UPI0036BF62B5
MIAPPTPLGTTAHPPHPAAPSDRPTPPFSVVLGADYAGKSSALAELARLVPDVRIVSADEELLDPGHSLITRLRRGLVGDVMPALHRDYSADFMLTMLQAAVLHLRDSIARGPAHTPVLVDSYYYKILAKCRLTGLDQHPLFDWWRSFPQPQQVIFLEVSAETAWRRCGEGRDLNPLEHYGTRPDRASFARFQADLHRVMWEEVRTLPVSFIGEQDRVSAVAREVREVLTAHEPV